MLLPFRNSHLPNPSSGPRRRQASFGGVAPSTGNRGSPTSCSSRRMRTSESVRYSRLKRRTGQSVPLRIDDSVQPVSVPVESNHRLVARNVIRRSTNDGPYPGSTRPGTNGWSSVIGVKITGLEVLYEFIIVGTVARRVLSTAVVLSLAPRTPRGLVWMTP